MTKKPTKKTKKQTEKSANAELSSTGKTTSTSKDEITVGEESTGKLIVPPIGFRNYLDGGRDIVDEWISDVKVLSKKGRGKLDMTLKFLSNQPINNWKRPQACSVGDHIYVIHFCDENKAQFRPFGFLLHQFNSFVITTPCIEKGGIYDPKNAKDITESRKIHVMGAPDDRSVPSFTNICPAYSLRR